VSFFYTSCSDRFGCPLASATMRELQERLREAGLLPRVTLLSITVVPVRDRPAQLAHYARAFGADPAAWHFLTAASDAGIRPVLEAYGQDRQAVHDERGRATGAYRHVLKVFLVDARGFIRNIYSTGFLVPAVVVNDVTTVLGEDRQARR
jgi:cytochrome oxidase Cu insertion factor (SCO1/SenC/PrrC family)